MNNGYYQKSLAFQEYLKRCAESIFRTYGRELVLRLEEYNLLQNKNNCIESSTAIGFVLEEFLVSKLEMFTHCAESDYVIDRFVGATSSESFDCSAEKDGTRFMVNVKSEKDRQNNDGIAAIGQLHRNYCRENPEQEKCFIVLKVKYSIQDAYEDSEWRRAKPRCIRINELSSYCLEEVDFSKGHLQDNRSWSNSETKNTRNNGRLKIPKAFRESHKVPVSQISYKNTFNMLDKLVANNK